MEAIIPVLIIFAVAAVFIFRAYQQHVLRLKAEEYDKLLKQARETRFQYVQAMQRTSDAQKELERLEENLTSLKAELYGYNKEFRALLLSLRAQIAKSTDSDLDKRTLGQMKLSIAEKWTHANNRKKDCLALRSEYDDAMFRFQQMEDVEHEITQLWKEQKELVLNFYVELKSQLNIPDPKKYFN